MDDALGVPVVRAPIYPYEESPPLDDIRSYITGSSIQWGTDLQITSAELSETAYLFFRIACHSLWPIFIQRILLFLGLDDFPDGEPVHIIAPIGATFLRQRAAHLRVGPTHPRGMSSSVGPPPSSSTGADTVEASGATAADVPPPTTSDDSDIRRTLDHVLTVLAANGQILVDVLDEIRGLHVELAQFQRSSLPPPFDDGF